MPEDKCAPVRVATRTRGAHLSPKRHDAVSISSVGSIVASPWIHVALEFDRYGLWAMTAHAVGGASCCPRFSIAHFAQVQRETTSTMRPRGGHEELPCASAIGIAVVIRRGHLDVMVSPSCLSHGGI